MFIFKKLKEEIISEQYLNRKKCKVNCIYDDGIMILVILGFLHRVLLRNDAFFGN